jgi:hypothetical protein
VTCSIIGFKHYLHSPLEKSLIKELTNILKIELNLLMINNHVYKMNVACYMYIIGYNSLSLCTMIQE